ncbi:MAG TPA: hypothetical protein VE821_06590 [Pyrinomonadaceae bacterium]|nr:hypothetical protein [Pyrinomonadaceae bacterium]
MRISQPLFGPDKLTGFQFLFQRDHAVFQFMLISAHIQHTRFKAIQPNRERAHISPQPAHLAFQALHPAFKLADSCFKLLNSRFKPFKTSVNFGAESTDVAADRAQVIEDFGCPVAAH